MVTNPRRYRWIAATSRPGTEPDTPDSKNQPLYSAVSSWDTVPRTLPVLVTHLIPQQSCEAVLYLSLFYK